MRAIFKDHQQQLQFEKDGFLKITLLTPDNVEELKKLYHHYFPHPSVDFYSSSYENDAVLKKEISDAIGKIILPNLEKVFIDYTWFGSAFLSKGDGARSEMPMHQDWTIVDETQFVALNIWTPLQATDEVNGTLEVMKGSHRWHDTVRAPTIPFYYSDFQEKLRPLLISIPTLPTEAVVLNQAVIHYSKSNKTKDIRIAITTGIKTKGAPMLFHYWDKNQPQQIELFKQEDDFLIRFENFHQSIFLRPTLGELIEVKPFQMKKPSLEEVERLLDKGKKKSVVQKMLQWIKG